MVIILFARTLKIASTPQTFKRDHLRFFNQQNLDQINKFKIGLKRFSTVRIIKKKWQNA